MSLVALGLTSITRSRRIPTQHVLTWRNWLQMRWVATRWISAQVIKHKTFVHRSNDVFVNPFMDPHGCGLVLDRIPEDAMPGVDVPRPLILPASARCNNNFRQDAAHQLIVRGRCQISHLFFKSLSFRLPKSVDWGVTTCASSPALLVVAEANSSIPDGSVTPPSLGASQYLTRSSLA